MVGGMKKNAAKKIATNNHKSESNKSPLGFFRNAIAIYFTILLLGVGLGIAGTSIVQLQNKPPSPVVEQQNHWFLLHRKSNIELLYHGVPGDQHKSKLLKVFRVKAGVPGQRPTPLPQTLGRQYWIVTGKVETKDSPETSPYFLTLNIPVSDEEPYGPIPYKECTDPYTGEKTQCNWVIPGAFGLHGISGDMTRLDSTSVGSSGCVRHTDEDITYLYTLLDPQKEEIRYYIEDI